MVSSVMANVGVSLKAGASYRFTCPNYLFPYEPHFNIPILISKSHTEQAFGRRIRDCAHLPNQAGTWRSPNWINVMQIRSIVECLPAFRATFNRSLLVSTLERTTLDRDFAERRSPLVRLLLSWLVRSRLHLLFDFVPTAMQPIIDCRVQKLRSSEV